MNTTVPRKANPRITPATIPPVGTELFELDEEPAACEDTEAVGVGVTELIEVMVGSVVVEGAEVMVEESVVLVVEASLVVVLESLSVEVAVSESESGVDVAVTGGPILKDVTWLEASAVVLVALDVLVDLAVVVSGPTNKLLAKLSSPLRMSLS